MKVETQATQEFSLAKQREYFREVIDREGNFEKINDQGNQRCRGIWQKKQRQVTPNGTFIFHFKSTRKLELYTLYFFMS